MLFVFVFSVLWQHETETSSRKNAELSGNSTPHAFNGLALSAHAAYVFDVTNKKPLYAYNAEAQVPLASLTKVMTALIAADTLRDEYPVVIGADSIASEGDSGFRVGEQWRLNDLIRFTLIESSNDGASALAAATTARAGSDTIARMNAQAKRIGLSQTYFLTPTGLDVNHSEYPGAVGSAEDFAHLFAYALRHIPDLLESTAVEQATFISLDGITHRAHNTNRSIANLPWSIASKTGTTELAGANLAVVFEAGPMRPFVVVVLGATPEKREQDVTALINATFAYLQRQ